MIQRFAVYDLGGMFAVVHASSADDAIRTACSKTDGHEAGACVALAVNGQKTENHNTDFGDEEGK